MSRLHCMEIMALDTLYANGSDPEPFSEDPRVLNIMYLYVIIIDTTLGYRSRNFVTQTSHYSVSGRTRTWDLAITRP